MSTRHSGVPPPKFFIECGLTCGRYLVSEDVARKFLTEDINRKLGDSLAKGAHGAILKFPNGCPKCTPHSASAKVIVTALKPKFH